jgi:hypothetical protein
MPWTFQAEQAAQACPYLPEAVISAVLCQAAGMLSMLVQDALQHDHRSAQGALPPGENTPADRTRM